MTRADITLGGGAKSFAQTSNGREYKGKTLEQQAIERGYQIVKDAKSLEAITLANQDKPVLVYFMTVIWPSLGKGQKPLIKVI
ncbi:alkaline phosphatase [Proteus mirabilis]|uniref:Alkaline phosphatase n=1 Tax=Proteus mirabilis TaxID=584 RepID=A0A379GBX3_PROMI|nr:alkaline phosphatase [Proteus mirabilis]